MCNVSESNCWIAHSNSIEGVDLRTDESLSCFKLPNFSSILHIWSPWQDQLAAATADGAIHLWDMRKLTSDTSAVAAAAPQHLLLHHYQTSLSCFASHPTLKNLIAL